MSNMSDLDASLSFVLRRQDESNPSPFAIGEPVRFSATFLRSAGIYTGEIPFARGFVVDVEQLGRLTLVRVDWDDDDIPPTRILAANLEPCK